MVANGVLCCSCWRLHNRIEEYITLFVTRAATFAARINVKSASRDAAMCDMAFVERLACEAFRRTEGIILLSLRLISLAHFRAVHCF